ncbi:hypothetical protein [Gabonibacter chumensis]|nr:hypothetical protein [Gabonibacter chumensis]MCR9012015.1 hypothetical protein [Gabonibacter chumensis]
MEFSVRERKKMKQYPDVGKRWFVRVKGVRCMLFDVCEKAHCACL